MLTVNQWIDENMKTMYGRQLRLLSYVTHKGIGDNYLPYLDCTVLAVKVTSKFVFIFI